MVVRQCSRVDKDMVAAFGYVLCIAHMLQRYPNAAAAPAAAAPMDSALVTSAALPPE